MARAGLAKEQLQKGIENFGTGNGEITNAIVVNHQFPPNKETGDQEELRPKIKLTIIRLKPDWTPDEDSDPFEEYIPLGGKGALAKFHPGNAAGPDDEEPEDLGDAEGVEGNAIYSEGAQVASGSKAGIFTISLEEHGFKPEYLNGYMPNLIGLQAHFVTKTMKSDEPGRKDWKVLTVDKIQRFPYQKGGKKVAHMPVSTAAPAPAAAKATGKPAPAPAPATAKGKATPPPPPPPVADDSNESSGPYTGSESAEEMLIRILTKIGEERSGSQMSLDPKSQPPASRLVAPIASKYNAFKVPNSMFKEINALLIGDDFAAIAAGIGWTVDEDGVTVNIP